MQNMAPPPPPPPLNTQSLKIEKNRRSSPTTALTTTKLEELKVAELKDELKSRGQKVNLIENMLPCRHQIFYQV